MAPKAVAAAAPEAISEQSAKTQIADRPTETQATVRTRHADVITAGIAQGVVGESQQDAKHISLASEGKISKKAQKDNAGLQPMSSATDAAESSKQKPSLAPDGITSGTVPEVAGAAPKSAQKAPSLRLPKQQPGRMRRLRKRDGDSRNPQNRATKCGRKRKTLPSVWASLSAGWARNTFSRSSTTMKMAVSLSSTRKQAKHKSSAPINREGKIVGLTLVSAEVQTQNRALIKAFAQPKMSKCALAPAEIVSEMQDKVFTPVKQIASQIVAAQQKMQRRIKEILIANAELIRWARDEFGAQGRKVPVPGTPTYNEWLKENLTIELPDGTKELACTDRYVRKVMAALDKQLANILREKLELPPVPKPPKKKKQKDREEIEIEAEVLAEAGVRLSDTLLGTGSAVPEPLDARVKKAVKQAESIKEAIADGNYERVQPPTKLLPKANTPKALFNFLNSEYIDVLDAVFDPESEPEEFARKLEAFAGEIAAAFHGTKVRVKVEVVSEEKSPNDSRKSN